VHALCSPSSQPRFRQLLTLLHKTRTNTMLHPSSALLMLMLMQRLFSEQQLQTTLYPVP
jgi:hypothetical protein